MTSQVTIYGWSTSGLIVDLGLGDGGQAGKVHDGQRGREHESAASLDRVASDQLALWER